jgi:DUF1365 family protein
MALGIVLSVDAKPVLKASVSGRRKGLSDANLARSFLSIHFFTLRSLQRSTCKR